MPKLFGRPWKQAKSDSLSLHFTFVPQWNDCSKKKSVHISHSKVRSYEMIITSTAYTARLNWCYCLFCNIPMMSHLSFTFLHCGSPLPVVKHSSVEWKLRPVEISSDGSIHTHYMPTTSAYGIYYMLKYMGLSLYSFELIWMEYYIAHTRHYKLKGPSARHFCHEMGLAEVFETKANEKACVFCSYVPCCYQFQKHFHFDQKTQCNWFFSLWERKRTKAAYLLIGWPTWQPITARFTIKIVVYKALVSKEQKHGVSRWILHIELLCCTL